MTYGQHFLINGHRAIILRMMILYLNLLSSGFGTPVSSDIIYFKMNLYDIRNDTLVGNGSNSELAFNCTTEEEYMVEGEPSSIVTETVVEASTNATTLADIVNASAASTGLVMDTTTISSTEDVAEFSTTAVINCTTMPEVKWDTTSLRTAVILQSISGNQSEKKNSLQTDFSVMNAALETLDLSMENITLNGTAMSGAGELCWFCNDTEEAQFNCQSGAWQLAECINMLQAERSHGGCYTWRKAPSLNTTVRGCLQDLSPIEMQQCRLDPKLCRLCFSNQCNDNTWNRASGDLTMITMTTALWNAAIVIVIERFFRL